MPVAILRSALQLGDKSTAVGNQLDLGFRVLPNRLKQDLQ